MSIWIKSWYKFFVDWCLLILKIKLISPNGKKLIKIFFSETINMIAPKLYINGYWKTLYKVGIFYICLVSRMDTTAWLSFKHMGKLIKAFFLNYRLCPKCTWLVIGWSLWKLSFFKWIGNPWWLPLHANQFFLAHLAFRPSGLLPSPFVCRPSINISHVNIFLRNHRVNCNQTLVEWSLDGPLSKLCPVIPTSNQDGRQAKNIKRGMKF